MATLILSRTWPGHPNTSVRNPRSASGPHSLPCHLAQWNCRQVRECEETEERGASGELQPALSAPSAYTPAPSMPPSCVRPPREWHPHLLPSLLPCPLAGPSFFNTILPPYLNSCHSGPVLAEKDTAVLGSSLSCPPPLPAWTSQGFSFAILSSTTMANNSNCSWC